MTNNYIQLCQLCHSIIKVKVCRSQFHRYLSPEDASTQKGDQSQRKRKNLGHTSWDLLTASFLPLGPVENTGVSGLSQQVIGRTIWTVSQRDHKEARTLTCNYSKRAEISKSNWVAHGLHDKKSIWTKAPLGPEHSTDQRVPLPVTCGHYGGKAQAKTKSPRRAQLPQIWCWRQDSFSVL